jgi:hypothetical protein
MPCQDTGAAQGVEDALLVTEVLAMVARSMIISAIRTPISVQVSSLIIPYVALGSSTSQKELMKPDACPREV